MGISIGIISTSHLSTVPIEVHKSLRPREWQIQDEATAEEEAQHNTDLPMRGGDGMMMVRSLGLIVVNSG